MTLTLLAVSLNDIPLSQPITASFDGRGGTIGRADHNTMALPDPERHISRLQAEVSQVGARFCITNVGVANPISVARRPLAVGESATLADGDEVRIGGYLLRVADGESASLTGATVTRGRALVTDALAGQAPASNADSAPASRGAPAVKVPAATPAAFRTAGLAPTLTPIPVKATGLAQAPAQALAHAPAHAPAYSPAVGRAAGSALPSLAEPLSKHNPFADLLGPSVPAPHGVAGRSTKADPLADPFAGLLAPAAGVPVASSAWASASSAGRASVLPEDFDPFAMPLPQRAADAPHAAADPFADLMPGNDAGSIDAAFNLRSDGTAAEALARFGSGGPRHSEPQLEAGISTDPMAMFGDAKPTPVAAPVANHASNLRAAFVPPKPLQAEIPLDATWLRPSMPRGPVERQGAVPAPALSLRPALMPESAGLEHTDALDFEFPAAHAAHTGAPQANTAGRDQAQQAAVPTAAPAPAALAADAHTALWQAFCAGAEIDLPLTQGLDAQTMHDVGQLLHAAVAGAMQLMAVRTNTKQELRAEVTVIQQRANNPMKFFPDAHAVLEQLLRPPMRGFLAGPEAMTEVMNDLVGHSIGTMAGMRAALDGVLGRFSPEQLESKLSGKSLLDSLLPMNRKARLWDLYLQHFNGIRDEAQDDFHTLFGKAFLAAYTQQLESLRPPRSPE